MWPFRKRTEDRALWQVGDAYPEPSTYAGVRVGPDTALRSCAVWACIRLLADTVSALPVDVYRQGSRTPIEPRPPLLLTPAAHTGLGDWLYQVMVSLLTRGNAYGLVVARTATERPAQIEMLDPGRVSVQLEPDLLTVTYRLDGREVTRDDLWHLAAYRVPGWPTGLSPVEYARQAIGLGLGAETFGAKLFGDNAIPSGVLTTEHDLTREQATNAKEMWDASHRGRRGTAVFGRGVKFAPITLPPEESQFIETQKWTVTQVCRVYGVPPEMVASDAGGSLTYATLVDRDLSFLKYGVNPWLVRLETALSDLLPRQTYAKFNTAALLKSDLKSRYESYEIALRAGFLTVDEVRELEDREPLPAAPARQLGSVA